MWVEGVGSVGRPPKGKVWGCGGGGVGPRVTVTEHNGTILSSFFRAWGLLVCSGSSSGTLAASSSPPYPSQPPHPAAAAPTNPPPSQPPFHAHHNPSDAIPSAPLFSRGESAPAHTASKLVEGQANGRAGEREGSPDPPRLNQSRFEAVCGALDPALNERPVGSLDKPETPEISEG